MNEEKDKSASNDPTQNKFWAFIKSGFGIWCLSTIIIPIFLFCFNNYRQYQKENSERLEKVNQLDLEIESRISQFWVHLSSLIDLKDTANYSFKQGVSSDTVRLFWEAFKNPPSFNPKLMTTIYKEYDSRTTVSLIIELSTLLEETTRKETRIYKREENAVKNGDINDIRQAAAFIAGDGIYDYPNKLTIKEVWNLFSKNIIIGRWDILFPYTDCLFC